MVNGRISFHRHSEAVFSLLEFTAAAVTMMGVLVPEAPSQRDSASTAEEELVTVNILFFFKKKT